MNNQTTEPSKSKCASYPEHSNNSNTATATITNIPQNENESASSSSSSSSSSGSSSFSIFSSPNKNKLPSFFTPTSTSNILNYIPTLSFTPGQGLLLASFPLLAGAYVGYRREMIHAQSNQYHLEQQQKQPRGMISKLVNVNPHKGNGNSATVTATESAAKEFSRVAAKEMAMVAGPGPSFYARALIYGSLLSIGGVSLLSAGAFYASGCQSLEELIESCREWAPRNRQKFERFLGIQSKNWNTDEDVVATAQMTQDEELDYYTNKYVGEEVFKQHPDEHDNDEANETKAKT